MTMKLVLWIAVALVHEDLVWDVLQEKVAASD
jgi:hypothetical protein